MTIHDDPGIYICGDRNDLNINPILALNPSLKQIVTRPTHGTKTHDIIITNLHNYMNTPIIVPTVTADNPLIGHPSDHSVPVATPLQSHDDQIRRDLKTNLFKPLPDSKLEIFQKWLIGI